jgi:hypothetical protein
LGPTWLTVLAWIYLSICFGCAAVVAYDIFINGRRQPMSVMNAVFPITALYFGPLALAFYWRWGRVGLHGTGKKPWWAMMATEVSHCGSGCVLGDVISEFAIFALALWLLMQTGMIVGYATSWPANAWLVSRGIKVPM